ncbi:unnamed protein product [Gongylonema pulchrum]|uniref:Uncharacterized protein n=1 Tax=Gongylonema pulchrum TaxID=637853 RepID=A0A3P6R3R6_9BILA|nr:unnamed protein product [Gongylonema pulchrum]
MLTTYYDRIRVDQKDLPKKPDTGTTDPTEAMSTKATEPTKAASSLSPSYVRATIATVIGTFLICSYRH